MLALSCVCLAPLLPSPPSPLQVLLDLREECEKYGSVSDVVVPRPAEPSRAKELWGTANYGKVGESGVGGGCHNSTHGVRSHVLRCGERGYWAGGAVQALFAAP